ncbi:MAG: flagellar basal-body rod protein FlgF [Nitrospirae bacterium]|nr:flagellar basal-body rod protein FlgF [Nitrospirota bacterium]MBI3351490.1 flagellar basal-body rod protein FlgF [Nitrospirota bacterium]
MMNAIYPMMSGAIAQEKNLEIISNNIANVNTAGFKKDRGLFMGLDPLGDSTPGKDKGVLPVYGFLNQTRTDFSPGAIQSTGEPLDLAIEGDGFFSVQTPEGIRYTRKGNFTLNSEGQISTAEGGLLMGTSGPITLPPGTVHVDQAGKVSVNGSEIDSLQVVSFSNPNHLAKTGGTFFEAGGEGALPAAEAKIHQGSIEGSNVNPVEEMVSMIRVMRLYEAAQKVIHAVDDMASKASNEIGKV